MVFLSEWRYSSINLLLYCTLPTALYSETAWYTPTYALCLFGCKGKMYPWLMQRMGICSTKLNHTPVGSWLSFCLSWSWVDSTALVAYSHLTWVLNNKVEFFKNCCLKSEFLKQRPQDWALWVLTIFFMCQWYFHKRNNSFEGDGLSFGACIGSTSSSFTNETKETVLTKHNSLEWTCFDLHTWITCLFETIKEIVKIWNRGSGEIQGWCSSLMIFNWEYGRPY